MRTTLDDDEAQEEDDWNIFEGDLSGELLPPTADEERQAAEKVKKGGGEEKGKTRTESPPGEPIKERRAVRVGGLHKEETETGEQTRKRINKPQKTAQNKSAGRGQRSERTILQNWRGREVIAVKLSLVQK